MFLVSRLTSKAPQVAATILIFSLSAGVLGGILFYMDSAGPDVLGELTEDIPVDMYVSFRQSFYNQNQTSISDIEDVLKEESAVIHTETLAILEDYNWEEEDWRDVFWYLLGVNESFFETFSHAIEVVDGELNLNSTTCLIEEGRMTRYGLRVGDNVTVSVEVYNETGDQYLVEQNYTVVGSFTTTLFMYAYEWGVPLSTSLFLVTTVEGLEEGFGEISRDSWNSIRDEIWAAVDHSLVLAPEAIGAMEDLEHRIEQKTLPLASVSHFALIDAVHEYVAWGISMRAIALSFSIPTIVMAIILVQYNSDLLADERRRDVGTLKTRGSSGWQAFRWILSNALIVGLIGGLGAVLVGGVSALLSGTVRELLSFDLTRLAEFTLLLQIEAVVAVFMFSFVVGLGVALPSAIRALLMSPTEAHSIIERDILLETEKMGSPAYELVALGITGYLLSPLLLAFRYIPMSTLGSMMFAAIVIPMLGIFVVAFTRLLSRPAASVKSSVLARIKGKSLHSGTKVISNYLRLFKKSESLGVMFIAMVFAAGIFSSLSANTASVHMREVLYFETGADIKIDIKPSLDNVTNALLEDISLVEGVESVSGVLETDGHVGYWTSDYGTRRYVRTPITVFGVQPVQWLESAFWLPYFTKDGTPWTSLPLLEADNTSVLTSFKPVDHYTGGWQYTPVYGNALTLELEAPAWTNSSDCTIVDVLADSYEGGYGGRTYLPGESGATFFVAANLAYVQACLNTTRINKVYVNLEPGANYTKALVDLNEVAPNSFDKIASSEALVDAALESRAGQSIYGAYTLNVIFSFLYLTAGILIVSMVRFRKLRRQFSIMRALGSEPRPIITSVLLESVTGIAMAATIGTLVGLLLTSLVIQLPLIYMGSMTALLWNRLPVMLAVSVPMLTGILGAAVLFTLAATYFVVVRNLRANIAQEIQYME
ncbi:MAG: FtsX-like permease family protein [Candidatus Thorarchaeota archaeon]